MTHQLNHVLSQLAHGLLTELPAQLATAAIVAATAGACRYMRRGITSKREASDTDDS